MTRPSPAERAAALRRDQQSAARRRNLYVAGAVAAVLAVLLTIGVVVQAGRDSTGDPVARTPDGVTAEHGVVVGDADAPTKVVVYEDFQCPVCKALEDETADSLADAVAAGEVSVEYRMVSFLDGASLNTYSSRAANAAAAVLDVAGPEAFSRFHAALFADQPAEGSAGPGNDDLVDAAVAAGAERSEVASLIDGGTFDAWVVEATDAMSQAGVTGTPTVWINGEPAGANPAEAAQALRELAE